MNKGAIGGYSWSVQVCPGLSPKTLELPLSTQYRFDGAGNRVQVGGNRYTYDGAGRMSSAVDSERGQAIGSISYDAFGNRISVTEGGSTVSYSYDSANRVVSSSAGESWGYDGVGNTVYYRSRQGEVTSTDYDAENRSTRSSTTGTDGKTTTSRTTYDAVGNVMKTRVDGDGFGFDEVTRRDLRYLETSKFLTNTWAKGARGLEGSSAFRYDANGNLTFLDRGRKQDAKQNTVAYFDYDNEGHIIGRADAPTANTDGGYFQGSVTDPDSTDAYDEYGSGFRFADMIRRSLFGALTSGTTHLQSYLYANGQQVAEGKADHVLGIKKLTLSGGEAITDAEGTVIGPGLQTLSLRAASESNCVVRFPRCR